MAEFAFASHVKVGENRYRERYGLDFEDFQVGQVFKHRPGQSISQQDNVEEAMDSLNQAMLHFDDNYAAKTEWKKPLMVSTITLQRMIGLSWKTFAKKKRLLGWADLTMTYPVFGGDTLYAESEIKATEEWPNDPSCGKLTVVTRGVNQDDKPVCTMEYDLLVYKRGQSPFEQANY
ncbi:MAG: MaoC family dehydratase [Deltaproteobacteria bacterium]|nr:MaoC family dehydratase [Deltaproteobacteria bacterium]